MADMPAEDLFVRQTERLLVLARQVAHDTEALGTHRDWDVAADARGESLHAPVPAHHGL